MHAIQSFTKLSLKRFKTLPLDKKSTDKLLKFLNNIELSSQRLLSLLNDLLDLSKLESGKADLDFKNNDLFTLSQQIEAEYSATILEKNINFILNKPSISSLAYCDKNKILQVLSNLIANAVKFTPEHKTITVTIENTEIILGRRVTDTNKTLGILYSISDQGVGIPNEELVSIFDKFIQSSKTKSGAGGTGLGLAISHEIILAHKGKIWAEHNPEGGAIFKVFLPISETQNK
jgi:signal transduction histidine kinase